MLLSPQRVVTRIMSVGEIASRVLLIAASNCGLRSLTAKLMSAEVETASPEI
ncbi:hypothetical protein D3C72_2196680 [compost metagenome]